jgi:hypothetical protein
MRVIMLTILLAILVFSISVISVSIYGDVRRVAGGSAEVEHIKVKVLEVRDEVVGINLKAVDVTVVVDVTKNYEVRLTVSKGQDSTSASWTGILYGGVETTITFKLQPPFLQEGEVGFSHRVEVNPL